MIELIAIYTLGLIFAMFVAPPLMCKILEKYKSFFERYELQLALLVALGILVLFFTGMALLMKMVVG